MEITRATLEIRLDYPGGKERKKLTIEVDSNHTPAVRGALEGCTDMLEALTTRKGGKIRKSNSIGLIGRFLDWKRRALRSLRN